MRMPDGRLTFDPFQAGMLIRVAMHRMRRKRRQAHGNIFRPIVTGGAVTHPLAAMHENRLSGGYFLNRIAGFHLQFTLKHNRVLVELRRLSRLLPARWTGHLGDTDCCRLRIHLANKLFDNLRRPPGRGNHGWFSDKNCHGAQISENFPGRQSGFNRAKTIDTGAFVSGLGALSFALTGILSGSAL